MNSPYHILNVSQDADKTEIKKAQMMAMKEKRFPLPDIAAAARQLLDPTKRLAADFMFPARVKAKRPKKINTSFTIDDIKLNDIDENAYDSI